MLSLHDATDLTKRFLLWAVIIVVGLTLLTVIVGFIKGLVQSPPPPPTLCYGQLPQVTFPKNSFSQNNYTYTINTLTGSLPPFADRVVVPTISQITPSLFGLQNASESANQLGFTTPAYALSSTEYEWIKYSSPVKTLKANVLTNDFTVTSNYYTDPIVTAAQNLPLQDDAINKAQDYLTSMLNDTTGFPSDVDPDKTLVTFYNINSSTNTIYTAPNKSLAQIIRVDFFQKDIADCYSTGTTSAACTIYYPNYPHSSIDVFIGAGQENYYDNATGQIVQADYFHRYIDKATCPDSNQPPTYPLKSTQAAYEELQKGNGYITSYDGSGTGITIKDVKLGYYLGTSGTQQYLQPIYVFTGDNNFAAYVPATLNEVPRK